MAKTAIEVDRIKLVTCIKSAEENGALRNFDELWIKVAELYNNMNPPKEITKSVVYLRVKEWGLTTKTKAGTRGHAPGSKLSDEQKAAMQAGRKLGGKRADKFKADPDIQQGFTELADEVPIRFEKLMQKLTQSGSMRAAIALKCLDCTCYQPMEIKGCACKSCPLFALRPYRNKATGSNEIVDELSETELLDEENEENTQIIAA
jgi:hypothetical protein